MKHPLLFESNTDSKIVLKSMPYTYYTTHTHYRAYPVTFKRHFLLLSSNKYSYYRRIWTWIPQKRSTYHAITIQYLRQTNRNSSVTKAVLIKHIST